MPLVPLTGGGGGRYNVVSWKAVLFFVNVPPLFIFTVSGTSGWHNYIVVTSGKATLKYISS